MSRWRSVNPAKYAPKSNAVGDMLEGFASVYVPAKMKQKELEDKREYEAEIERKKKNAAAAKATAEQDKKDKKLSKDAKVLAQRYSGTTDNSEAVLYFTQQLQLFDGDVADVITSADSMVEKGQLKFTSQQFEEEITRVDPTKAPPVRLDSIGSFTSTSVGEPEGQSRPLNSRDLNRISNYKDDEDASDTAKENAVVAAQMKENFGDQQLESSETETVIGTQYGVEINPAGKKSPEIDAEFLRSNANTKDLAEFTINKLREEGFEDEAKAVEGYAAAAFKKEDLSMTDISQLGEVGRRVALEDKSGKFSVTDKANITKWNETEGSIQSEENLKALRGKSEVELTDILNSPASSEDEKIQASALLKGRSPEPFKIEDYDDVKDIDVLKIARDAAPAESVKKAQLTTLIAAREAAETGKMPKLNLEGGFFVTTYTDGEGQLVVTTTAPSDQGIYDINNMVLVPQDKIKSNQNMKMLDTIADAVAQAQDKSLKPITESRRQMAFMLRSADRLEKFVNPEMGGSPAILTTVGGDITRVVERLGNEYNALNQLFLKGASNEEVFRYIEGEQANYSELAGLSSQFQAELLKHAYLYATTVLEQRGTGLSNQDFNKALDIVKAGSSYSTFSNNLRSQSRQAIAKVNDLVSDLEDTNIQVMVLDRLDPSGDLTAGYKMSAEEFLDKRNLTSMVTWANGEAKEIEVNPPPEGGGDNDPKTVGQSISDFKNDENFTDIQTQINKLSNDGNTTSLNRALEIYSKQSGIPIDILKKDVFNLGSEGN